MSYLEISLIRSDRATQPRAHLNQKLIGEYAEAMTTGVKFPPVTVFYDDINYWLADGFHRLEAALKTGASSIAVDIRQGTYRDAVLYSVGANAKHGLRRSNTDKRRAVLTLLADPEWSQWSNNEIAKQCCVAEGLVRKLKEELCSYKTKIDSAYAKKYGIDEDTLKKAQQRFMAQPQERMAQRCGTTYIINTANIGKRNKTTVSTDSTEKSSRVEVLKAESTVETKGSADQTREHLPNEAQTQTPMLFDSNFIYHRDFDSPKFSEVSEMRLPSAVGVHVLTPYTDKHFHQENLSSIAPLKHFEVGDNICIQHSYKSDIEKTWINKTPNMCQVTTDKLLEVDVEGQQTQKFMVKPDCVEQLEPQVEKTQDDKLESEATKEFHQLNTNVRVINIKQESQQQVEKVVQTFEVTFPGACIEIEGCPDTLVLLFQQMHDNPKFAEEVLRQAYLRR